MTKIKRIGTVAVVGMCMGATMSAFAAGSSNVRWKYHCNKNPEKLAAKIEALEAKLEAKSDNPKQAEKLREHLAELYEQANSANC